MNSFDTLISGTLVYSNDDVTPMLNTIIPLLTDTGHPLTPDYIATGLGLDITKEGKLIYLIEDIAKRYEFTADNILQRYLGLGKVFTPLCRTPSVDYSSPRTEYGYASYIACIIQNCFIRHPSGNVSFSISVIDEEFISKAIGHNIFEPSEEENKFILTNNFRQFYIYQRLG